MTEQTKWTPDTYVEILVDADRSWRDWQRRGAVGQTIVEVDSYDYHVARAAWEHAMQGIANPEAVAGLVEAAWAAAEELERLSDVRGHMATRRAWHGLLAALAALDA